MMTATLRRLAVHLLGIAVVAVPVAANTAQHVNSHAGVATGLTGRFTLENNPWFNSAPLTPTLLRGKVVVVNFWTYSCINSLRALPYTKSWAARYERGGLIVVGVHTPEFGFEHKRSNVAQAVRDLAVTYPVVMDSDYAIWHAFDNEYWPAFYLLDRKGRLRYRYFGEGDYDKTEQVIRELLKEGGGDDTRADATDIVSTAVEVAPSWADEKSPETYLGYQHGTDAFASPQRLSPDAPHRYRLPRKLALNGWGLSGSWEVRAESATLLDSPGKIVIRFHSRDLHLVLGPADNGKPVRFRVRLDGGAPNDDHGADCAKNGSGEIRKPRLYQLVRQKHRVEDRTFEVEFLDPGVHAYVFTFG